MESGMTYPPALIATGLLKGVTSAVISTMPIEQQEDMGCPVDWDQQQLWI
jgi:hypothetical protein